MSATLHNRSIGPFIVSAGLRKDGGRSVELSSDFRSGGSVIAALITPGPIIVVFHRPTLDALAAQLDDTCYECGIALAEDEGTTVVLEFWVFPESDAPEGAEEVKEARPTRLCDEDAALFTR